MGQVLGISAAAIIQSLLTLRGSPVQIRTYGAIEIVNPVERNVEAFRLARLQKQ
jgi:hypothetical protein